MVLAPYVSCIRSSAPIRPRGTRRSPPRFTIRANSRPQRQTSTSALCGAVYSVNVDQHPEPFCPGARTSINQRRRWNPLTSVRACRPNPRHRHRHHDRKSRSIRSAHIPRARPPAALSARATDDAAPYPTAGDASGADCHTGGPMSAPGERAPCRTAVLLLCTHCPGPAVNRSTRPQPAANPIHAGRGCAVRVASQFAPARIMAYSVAPGCSFWLLVSANFPNRLRNLHDARPAI
jgi:hypothetical protein